MKQSILRHLPRALLLLLTVFGSAHGADQPAASSGSWLMYVGTYTGRGSRGIYAFRLDPTNDTPAPLGLVAETPNPSFLAISPDNHFLYAVNEQSAGSVSAFSIDAASGKLTLLNQQTSGGKGPCQLTVDAAGKHVLVANYDSGSVEDLPIEAGGRLGASITFIQHTGSSINPSRQSGPHAHCFALDAANHFALVCDLGLDKIFAYHFDSDKGLSAADPVVVSAKPGSGPRHVAFSPDGRQAFVIHEMGNIIVRYGYDAATGMLTEMQTVSTLPDNYSGNSSTAEIAVHPNGKFVYGSNRGDDSIVVFAIDPADGKLTFVERAPTKGRNPRFFTIDPSGKLLYAANQDSRNIVIFNLDPATGKLEPTGKVLSVPSPVCLRFVPVKE